MDPFIWRNNSRTKVSTRWIL